MHYYLQLFTQKSEEPNKKICFGLCVFLCSAKLRLALNSDETMTASRGFLMIIVDISQCGISQEGYFRCKDLASIMKIGYGQNVL